eukprot:4990512-Prymnesium_polylepis.1
MRAHTHTRTPALASRAQSDRRARHCRCRLRLRLLPRRHGRPSDRGGARRGAGGGGGQGGLHVCLWARRQLLRDAERGQAAGGGRVWCGHWCGGAYVLLGRRASGGQLHDVQRAHVPAAAAAEGVQVQGEGEEGRRQPEGLHPVAEGRAHGARPSRGGRPWREGRA